MLQILLTILKILGILILVILGIILTVILLVLLVPIRYGADVSFDGKPSGNISVSWLLRMISVRVSYDGKVKALVKLLWFRLFDKTVWPAEDDADVSENSVEDELEDDFFSLVDKPVEITPQPEKAVIQSKNAETEPKKAESKPKKIETQPKKVEFQPKKVETQQEPPSDHSENVEEKRSLFEKLQSAFEQLVKKIFDTIQRIREKKEQLSQKIDQIMSILKDQENQKTFKLVMRQIGRLFKHILPQRIRGRLKFGFDDPYTTGQILTYISPFYGVYAKTLILEPVFDEKEMEGELHIKGRIRLGSLLWIVIRILLDKNFRRLLKGLLAKKK